MSLRQSSTVDSTLSAVVRRVAPTGPDTRLLRGGCVFDSSTRPTRGSPPVAPTKFDSSDDASRRIGPDTCDYSDSARRVVRRARPAARLVRPPVPSARVRLVRLLRLLGRVARRVTPAARLVRPPVPSARVRLVRLVRLFDLSHDASTSRSDSSDKGRLQAGPTRPTRQTPRRFSSRSGPQVPLCTHCVNCIRSTCWTTAKRLLSMCHGSSLQRRPGCKDAPPPSAPERCAPAGAHLTSRPLGLAAQEAWPQPEHRPGGAAAGSHRGMAKIGVQPRALFESDELLVVGTRQLLADSVAQAHERARRMPRSTTCDAPCNAL